MPAASSNMRSSSTAHGLSIALPREPLLKIRPNRSWAAIDLREVWAHREIFFLLIWRDLKLRYRQTLLGAAWVILQPLLMTLVFTVFFGLIGHPPVKNVPYPLFVYAGLLPWTFFSTAVLGSSYSLISQADMIRKTYFPRVLLPAAAVAVRLSDFIISLTALIFLMIYYGVYPTASILWMALVVLNLFLFTVGLGTWLAALNIRYEDVGTVLPVLLQIWMFVSPIIYPSSLVPRRWTWLYYLNPLAGIIEGFRASLFNLEFNRASLLVSFLVTIFLLVLISFSFRRMEDGFADII
ncbi:MAG TPA: ABC transporter permease [Pyrinomonadaceae bacterium]|jgi:lipopolysaccharide transport system permease protein